MSNTDIMHKQFFAAILVLLMLVGVAGYLERGRTLECRNQAQTNGATTADAVKLCKH